MPRVGSSRMSTAGSVASQRASSAFCGKGTPAEVERLLDGVKEEIASFKDLRLGRRDRRRPGQ